MQSISWGIYFLNVISCFHYWANSAVWTKCPSKLQLKIRTFHRWPWGWESSAWGLVLRKSCCKETQVTSHSGKHWRRFPDWFNFRDFNVYPGHVLESEGDQSSICFHGPTPTCSTPTALCSLENLPAVASSSGSQMPSPMQSTWTKGWGHLVRLHNFMAGDPPFNGNTQHGYSNTHTPRVAVQLARPILFLFALWGGVGDEKRSVLNRRGRNVEPTHRVNSPGTSQSHYLMQATNMWSWLFSTYNKTSCHMQTSPPSSVPEQHCGIMLGVLAPPSPKTWTQCNVMALMWLTIAVCDIISRH